MVLALSNSTAAAPLVVLPSPSRRGVPQPLALATVQKTMLWLSSPSARASADARHMVGNMGERWAADKLRGLGCFSVRYSDYGRPADLQATRHDTGEILYIECKAARRSCDGKYRFTLVKRGRYGSTSLKGSHVVVLMCFLAAGQVVSFVVPTWWFAGNAQAVVTSNPLTYSGRLSVWGESWADVLLSQQY